MAATESTNPKEKGSRSKRIIIIVLILLLVGANGYLAYTYYQHEKKISNQKTTITNLEDKKAELNAKIDSMEQVIVQWQDSSEVLNKKLAELKKELEKKKEELDRWKGAAITYKQQKEELERINAEIKATRDSLKARADSLLAENTELKDTLQETTMEKKQLAEEKTKLEKKIKKERLQPQNISPKGLIQKEGGKNKETDNASRVDIFRVCYDVPASRVEPPGEKKIYIQVTDPQGQIMTVNQDESGSFKLAETGNSIEYTAVSSFTYDQSRKEGICLEWEVSDLPEGKYMVKLFQRGKQIGKKELKLGSGFLGIF